MRNLIASMIKQAHTFYICGYFDEALCTLNAIANILADINRDGLKLHYAETITTLYTDLHELLKQRIESKRHGDPNPNYAQTIQECVKDKQRALMALLKIA